MVELVVWVGWMEASSPKIYSPETLASISEVKS
jgi:hypothetical protein